MSSEYWPLSEESADNATAVEFEILDRRYASLQFSLEITTGTASGGTVSISALPRGGSDYVLLGNTFDCTAPDTQTANGRYDKIKFTPASLTSGAKFTAFVDRLSRV
jgi:hypothetical protein